MLFADLEQELPNATVLQIELHGLEDISLHMQDLPCKPTSKSSNRKDLVETSVTK